MQLYEKHRPTDWDGIVGQDKAVATLRRIIDRSGAGGKAFWITGPTGHGKTTLARIIASKLGSGATVHEYRCADELTAAEVAAIDQLYRLNTRGLFAMPHCIIVNEVHGLSARQVRTLLGLLEPIPESVCWVFTTTWDGQNWLEDAQIDATALMGRCVGGKPIRLTNQGMAPAAAELVRRIAQAEGLDGQPPEAYLKLAREHKASVRAMLQAVEAGCMATEGGAS